MYEINETHDPNLKSWVESANTPNTDFPIQNLPFCRFINDESERVIGLAIGDKVLEINAWSSEIARLDLVFQDLENLPPPRYFDISSEF